jgi:hypothetical protein
MTSHHIPPRGPARTRPVGRLRRAERGSASAELVLVFPIVLLAFLLIAQVSLWAHARHIAHAAAGQALTATRVRDGTPADGQRAAHQLLDQVGTGPLRDTQVAVTRGPEQSTVDITGQATSIAPFLTLTVRAHVVGPTERRTTAGAP